MRPADAVETLECWAAALARQDGPSVLALTRQNVPAVRTTHVAENLSARGAYVVAEAAGARDVTLIGTGSEVSIALVARDRLGGEGINAAVVSMPCWSLFDRQSAKYRREVLGPARVAKVAVEAGVGLGWERYIGPKGAFVCMTSFGASAPYGDLYKHFGITAEAVAAAAKRLL